MANAPEPQQVAIPTVVDDIRAPDVFADAIAGVFLTHGNFHMTFVARRCDYSKDPNMFSDAVIGRLVMPFAAVENMVEFLGNYVQRVKNQSFPAGPQDPSPRTLQ